MNNELTDTIDYQVLLSLEHDELIELAGKRGLPIDGDTRELALAILEHDHAIEVKPEEPAAQSLFCESNKKSESVDVPETVTFKRPLKKINSQTFKK